MTQRTIHITGNAKNIDGEAVVEAENIGTYIITGMGSWDKNWVNQRIKVIGDLKADKKSNKDIIVNPLVQLAKN